MSRFWQLSRGRIFSAGGRAFNTCARAQYGTPSKLEQFGEVYGISTAYGSHGTRTLSFCSPFSVGTETLSLSYEVSQSKSSEELADSEGNDEPYSTLGMTDQVEALGEVEVSQEESAIDVAKRILEICEGKSWNVDVEEALSGFSKELTNKVVKKVLQKMQIDNLKVFFTWAGKQEGYEHGRHEYRALVGRFLRAGKFDMVVEFLEEMRKKDIRIFSDDFAKVVYHSGKAGRMNQAKEAVEIMKSYGVNPDAKVYGAFLSGHLEANDEEGVASILQNLSDVEEFNSAISTFARAGKPDSALRMLEIMEEKGCSANLRTLDLLLRCLCSADRTEEALEAFQNMQEKGLVPDVNIYNFLISRLCEQKEMDEAMKLFSQMKAAGCQPDIVTHTSLISGYLKLRQVAKAHQHVELMKAEDCMPNRQTSRLFVVNLSRCEELEKALQEFRQAAESGEHLSIDACNCLLKGLIKAGRLDAALKVFEDIKGVADTTTYVVLLRGCCNLSRFDAIEHLLAEVRMRKLQLPVSTYVVLLQTYSRAKIFKKVAFVFKELQENGQSWDSPKTNTAVLDALSRGHQLETGVEFCKYLVDHGQKINMRQLKHFLRLLIKSGRAGEATELMKALSEKDLVIPEKSQRLAA